MVGDFGLGPGPLELGDGDDCVEGGTVGVEGAQNVHLIDARCVIASGGGFWLFSVQGQGDLWAVAAGGLERLQDVLGGVGGGAPAAHTRTIVAVCAQCAVAVPRRLPDAARLVQVHEPAREVSPKPPEVAAAPGPGEQTRRGAQHTAWLHPHHGGTVAAHVLADIQQRQRAARQVLRPHLCRKDCGGEPAAVRSHELVHRAELSARIDARTPAATITAMMMAGTMQQHTLALPGRGRDVLTVHSPDTLFDGPSDLPRLGALVKPPFLMVGTSVVAPPERGNCGRYGT
ncbi:hypothetical protein [Streptomyces ardesiacus]|uniref:hypothetical protein n=1 Tax=Streptomyces ardesiacus TaxID=285564 RepID=UPI0006E18884|nr:hypothetical protein [Streptomyces sp. NBRC 110030]